MDRQIEFTDRYQAAGIPQPDPETMCDECEGMGCYPVHRNTDDAQDRALWVAHDKTRRTASEFFRLLWAHKELWFWRSMLRDLWCYGLKNWACDDWHFVQCPYCNGSRITE